MSSPTWLAKDMLFATLDPTMRAIPLPGAKRAILSDTSSETAEHLQLALETSDIAAVAMAARLRLPDIEGERPAEAPSDPRPTSRGWRWSSARQPMPAPTEAAGCAGSART
jgi:hypothetical protein